MGARKNEIIDKNYKCLDRLIRRLSGRYGADSTMRDELYQEGWQICLKSVKTFKETKNNNFVGYMNDILAIQMVKLATKAIKELRLSEIDLPDESSRGVREKVMSAIEELDEVLCDLIYSFYYHGVPLERWAELNNISHKTAAAHWKAAHAALKPKLIERGLGNGRVK